VLCNSDKKCVTIFHRVPFKNPTERAIHFAKHGHQFQVADEFIYEQLADAFMFGGMNANMEQCFRPSGNDRLRLNFLLVHFGVASVMPEFVKTFYPVQQKTITWHGGNAGFFTYECGRVMP